MAMPGMTPADSAYLKDCLGEALSCGMAKVASCQPEDAVDFLGAYLILYADKQRENAEVRVRPRRCARDPGPGGGARWRLGRRPSGSGAHFPLALAVLPPPAPPRSARCRPRRTRRSCTG